MNSTVLYSLRQDGGAVTAKDLALQTPYNTYLNVGLTPTPICIPSPQALTAAVHPPAGAWLYFVLVKKDGTEAFADTFPEQLANEQLARAAGGRVMAGGPSHPVDSHTTLVGVIGHPVRHSLSPLLHNTAFAALRLNWTSLAFEVPPGQVAGAQRDAALGLAGLSVTMPHKADAAALVDERSAVAAALGAVNCVVNEDGRLRGENTDGAGFLASLARGADFDPAGKRCLILGAGGAARAVTLALAGAGAPRWRW